MDRHILEELVLWKDTKNRKPLVIRGARQVGKTYIVKEFGRLFFKETVSINFDRHPEIIDLFRVKSIPEILQLLEVEYDTEIIPGQTLLFFDEIQSVPELLPLLRYFYEELPELHIISAGSLLEFLLADHDFSMPVGRVEYMHLGPMNFEEFLIAQGQKRLVSYLGQYNLEKSIPTSLHNKLMNQVRLFFVVGGMPSAVSAYIATGKIKEATREHESILQTYVDDFTKYGRKIYPQRLRNVFKKMPALIGDKIKYVNIDRNERAHDLSQTLDLLEMAKIIFRVRHSAGNGVPLGAQAKDSDFKIIFLDTGLVSTSLGLNLSSLETLETNFMTNRGAISEQFIGQHLLYMKESYKKPDLYYWNREKRNSSAEIDYLISLTDKVVPVEVKAGKTGSLKSLQVFITEKKCSLALRFNASAPSYTSLETSMPGIEKVPYRFVSLPLYLVGQSQRLLGELDSV